MGDLFKSLEDAVMVRERNKRIGATTDSIALIACNSGKGVILAYDGEGIEADIEALGLGHLDDHGLDDAPDGLSIWEGYLASYRCGERGEEYEAQLEGKFRPLTAEEWGRYQAKGLPWAFELAR